MLLNAVESALKAGLGEQTAKKARFTKNFLTGLMWQCDYSGEFRSFGACKYRFIAYVIAIYF